AQRQAERQVFFVLLGQGGNAELHPRQVDGGLAADAAAPEDAAADLGIGRLDDDELDRAVGEENVVAGADVARQLGEGRRDGLATPGEWQGRDREGRADGEGQGRIGDLTGPNLRSLKVLQDAHVDAETVRLGADHLQRRAVLVRVAVGEVEPRDVHA